MKSYGAIHPPEPYRAGKILVVTALAFIVTAYIHIPSDSFALAEWIALLVFLAGLMLTGIAGLSWLFSKADRLCNACISEQTEVPANAGRSESLPETLSLALEQSFCGVVITNLHAEIEYVNKTFCQTSGFERHELIGKNPGTLKSGKVPQETYQALWSRLEAGLTWKGDLINRHRNGSDYIQLTRISPIRQADGNITHYLGIVENITKKKLIEQQQERQRQHLEGLIAERTTQLEKACLMAEQANSAKSIFLTNMSHEIRTPMNAIIGMVHLMRRTSLTSTQNSQLEKIDHAAQHLLSLINDILDLSRIEAGKLVLEEREIRVETLLEGITSILSPRLEAKNLSLVIDSAPLPTVLLGDPKRLTQALLNYATNAIKFTSHGSIRLGIQQIEDKDGTALLHFEISDKGIGIAPEHLHKLFNPFQQAETSILHEYGGTGLGLAITRHLAELMGGEAGVRSELGVGSDFWFTARLKKADWHSPEPVRPSDEMRAEYALANNHAGKRILLVEDDPMNQEITIGLLDRTGLIVEVANNGAEALTMVAQTNYDLILMDIEMPIIDGLTATRRIRELANTEHIPIIAMTANAFAEDRNRCLTAGMNGYVTKPFAPQTLYATLLEYLPTRQANHCSTQTAPGIKLPRDGG